MNTPFRIVAKAWGKEGVFHFLISALVVAIAGGFLVVSFIYDVAGHWLAYGLMSGVGVVGTWFLVHATIDIVKRREWVFSVDGDRLRWVSRDGKSEKVEGEIYLRDIRALIYNRDDGDVGAHLEIEFVDHTVKQLPLVGVPSRSSLSAFVHYWREAHPEIPFGTLKIPDLDGGAPAELSHEPELREP